MLVELLGQVLQIKGVTSTAVVSPEGLILEGLSNNDTDLSFIGGLIASGLASSRVLAGILGKEEVVQTMIEYEGGPVLLTPLPGSDAENPFVSVVTLDSSSNLGRARFQLRKLLPQIAEVVIS